MKDPESTGKNTSRKKTHIRFHIIYTCVPLVDRDKCPVARIVKEKGTCEKAGTIAADGHVNQHNNIIILRLFIYIHTHVVSPGVYIIHSGVGRCFHLRGLQDHYVQYVYLYGVL